MVLSGVDGLCGGGGKSLQQIKTECNKKCCSSESFMNKTSNALAIFIMRLQAVAQIGAP